MTFFITLPGDDSGFLPEIPTYDIPDITTGLIHDWHPDDYTGSALTSRVGGATLTAFGTAGAPTVETLTNGRKMLVGDGTKRLGIATGLAGMGATADITIAAVVETSALTAGDSQFFGGGSSGQYRRLVANSSGNFVMAQGGGGGATAAALSLGASGLNVRRVVTLRFGAVLSGRANGQSLVTSATPITQKPEQGGFSVFGNAASTPANPLTGKVGRIRVFNRLLSDADLDAQIEALRTEYAITP